MTRYVRGWIASALLLGAGFAGAQADPATIDRIVDEGKNRSQIMDHLRYISKAIGPRLSTSPNLDKAYAWTMKKFTEFGCKNVHLEEWAEWPVGFERGKRQVGKMVLPYEKAFEFTTASWTPGTRGAVRGKAVLEPKTMEEFRKVQRDLKGAWMIVTRQPTGGRGAPAPTLTDEEKALQDAIAKSGIAGRVSGSRTDLVLTGGRYNIKWEELPKDVRVTVRKRDMESILYHLEKGREVVLEFDLQQRFIRGPRKMYNVVAEIPGTEKPDEIVIVGGHLDSWDGPGSEGAADNGTGTMAALEAARILNRVGAKPKRTIRFVLFTAEEQGLFGSRAYVEKHKDELPKISAVFIEDGGANYESGTYALESMLPFLQPIVDVNNRAFPDMPMTIRTVTRMPRGGGSDHVPFNAVGVPAFFWDKTGTADYNYIHHTQHDTFELVPVAYTVQSAVNEAVAVYIVACAPSMLPREVPATPPPAGGGGGGR
jgi:carboxypeptidase Q